VEHLGGDPVEAAGLAVPGVVQAVHVICVAGDVTSSTAVSSWRA
jgi:hypothetical protein